jgi:hypothetical protein
MIKIQSERIPLSEEPNRTPQQVIVYRCFRRASTHYRFLLSLVCSASFKNYFSMITDTQGRAVLPVRQQRVTYVGYSNKFRSNVAVGAEVEPVEDEQLEDEQLKDEQLEDEAPFEGVS